MITNSIQFGIEIDFVLEINICFIPSQKNEIMYRRFSLATSTCIFFFLVSCKIKFEYRFKRNLIFLKIDQNKMQIPPK